MREIVYPLSAFTKAAPPAADAAGAARADAPAPNSEIVRIASVDELAPYNVPPRVLVIIVQGHHPEKPKDGDNSRSNWLFDVLCWLYRCDVPEDVMYAIITDKGFAISASVLDKGSNTDKYARRQMARAKNAVAAAQDDPVAWVNQRYFAALEGGRIRYYREDRLGGRAGLAMMNADAFTFELAPYSHVTKDTNGNLKSVPYSKVWHFSSKRRYYRRGFVLDPMHGEHDEEYNLWRGFGIEPRAGDWSKMRAHISEVLAAGNADHADYIVRWAAWAVQNPGTPPRVALVFRGAEGVGKGVFAYSLVEIFGDHGLRIQTMAHLTGKFNAHLRHLCMLFADEAVAPGDATEVGSLKGMITEPTVPIEAKGIDVVNADNHIHLVMASNEKWVIPASINARRFAMFDVPDIRRGDRAYFAALFNEIENGGRSAMLHDLLAMDLAGWHPDSHRPETDALVEQKIRSLRGIEREWHNVLLMGELPIHDTLKGGFIRISTNDLLKYIQYRLRGERITANDLAALFGKDCMGFEREEAKRPRGYILPSLEEARTRWDEKMFPVRWPATSTGWHNDTIEPF